MRKRLARDVLASLAIFLCVLGVTRCTPTLAAALRPYLTAVLTETTNLADLFAAARLIAAGVPRWGPAIIEARRPAQPETPSEPEGAPGTGGTQGNDPRALPAGGGPAAGWRDLGADDEEAIGSPAAGTAARGAAADDGAPGVQGPAVAASASASPGPSPEGGSSRGAKAAVAPSGGSAGREKTPAEKPERVELAVPVHGQVTYGFGYRIHPIYRRRLFHEGLDIAAPKATPIRACLAGMVTRAGPLGTYGTIVEIDHGNGLATFYAHCSKALVRPGDRVRAGQKVAEVGSTGLSTGPHLHFEVIVDAKPQDPFAYLGGGRRDTL